MHARESVARGLAGQAGLCPGGTLSEINLKNSFCFVLFHFCSSGRKVSRRRNLGLTDARRIGRLSKAPKCAPGGTRRGVRALGNTGKRAQALNEET